MFKLQRSEPLRSNKLVVFKTRCRRNIRKNFFTYRMVHIWNKLPDNVILSNNLNSFKNNLSKLLYR